ncbi:MAG: XrtN system VIT domain-containing protein, partial [Bacteroidota bacterium]
ALYSSRHKTEPRLWSGKDLRTRDIVTNVQLFPAHRLAYTEKTLLIENTHEWSENQQEAIYSFYLPEGSVVTSASLWIGDREEKAYLTTRQKADTAYQTIVGRERRDPMLVRWQESNRVSVRVFPCTPKEKRKFKIGITSPLRFEAGRLVYENIDFDGCDKNGAQEIVQVLTEGGDPVNLSSSLGLKNKGAFRHFSGKYQPDWSLKFDAPPLSEAPFSFNGRTFQLQPLEEKYEPAPFREIYFDINDGWKKSEFKKLWRSLKDKEVYAWSGGMVRLTEENKDEVFEELNHLNYSLFPFDKISNPAEAVVVTAGCGFAPVPGDLDTCLFAKNLMAFFAGQEKPLRVLNLGKEISPFIKGLAETRSLQVHACDL